MGCASSLRGFLAIVAVCTFAGGGAAQSTDEGGGIDPADVVADQIRLQGYTCYSPTKASKDEAASQPNETVWNLSCANASYRVTLVPDMAATVEEVP
ncbi:MAG: hypothetical protein AAGJ94_09395 [Pseudomonadota bacterium]